MLSWGTHLQREEQGQMQQSLAKAGRKLGLGPTASTCPWCLFSLLGAGQLATVASAWAGAELIQGNKTQGPEQGML